MTTAAPHLLLIGTGGTIAMRPDAGGGVAPSLGPAELVALGIVMHLPVRPLDLFAKGSASISLSDVGTMAAAVSAAAQAGAVGAIISHGTDTIAETAFALALMLARPTIPVVLTGAMRHADAPGADGAANLAAAALVVSAQEITSLGEPVVVIADEIHLARHVHKAHGSRLHAFSSAPLGPIGWVREGRAVIALHPTAPLPQLPLVGPAPAVPMLLVGSDLEPESITPFMDAQIGGMVLAAAGGGHVSARAVAALSALAERVPVILASRCEGGVLTGTYGYAGGEMELIARGLTPAGMWRPEQARIILQLALSASLGRAGIAQALAAPSA
jgi:L-asparaginase